MRFQIARSYDDHTFMAMHCSPCNPLDQTRMFLVFLPALLQKLVGESFLLFFEGNLPGILRDFFGPTEERLKKFV